MRFLALLLSLFVTSYCFCQDYYLFVGTYTNGKSKGIYIYDFNGRTGGFTKLSETESKNPSYLAISRDGKFVYAVNENGGAAPGDVSAFAFDRTSAKLKFINKEQSGGFDPCFIAISKKRNWALAANYSSGSLSALPIHNDGSVGRVAQVIIHDGKGFDPQRQEKPHVHSAFFSPDESTVFSADLGLDKVALYHFDQNAAMPLSEPKDSIVAFAPGTGPRHIAFHPTKPFAYVLGELSGTVDVFRYGKEKVIRQQRINSTAEGFKGDKGSADIHASPNGKFLYASNRGDANNLVIYSIDSASGKLTLVGFQDVRGKHPRNFIIDPGGHFLLVANRDTDNVVIFKIDQKTGMLSETKTEISVPNPVCLKLLAK